MKLKISFLMLFFVFCRINIYGAGNIYDKIPQQEEPAGYLLPMSLELLPGCGFLYMNEYKEALFFSSFKITGLLMSAYYFDKAFNGSYSENTTDRYKENFVLASSISAAVYAVSWFVLFDDISVLNERAVPMFDISFDCNEPSGAVFYSGAVFRF
ncbi:MAG: hypothetical protein JW982_15245 [Spirochaetes bacterium]|nr:hypothetical protein [Spirochaetota bacterium]